jgi:DHA2 family multidrug resistance protein
MRSQISRPAGPRRLDQSDRTAARETRRTPITIGIMLATVMGAIDMTVVNVAMPHMQGSLSASPEQITWVITSYIVAVAATMPVSGWLAARVGLKRMLLLSIGCFTLVSALCGAATTLPAMVALRVLQGMVVAPMPPIAQAVLLNISPPERQGRAMALFSMAAVAAPVVGPLVGGYLTEELSWRWCFYVNLPAGAASILLLWIFLPQDRPVARKFDFLGFGSLAVGISACQLMMDRGPSRDWFGSREIWIEAILAAGAFWVYLAHTLTAKHPLFDKALARDRNFVATTAIGFLYSVLVYSTVILVPLMMQGVMGYPVMLSGLASTPRGLLMICILQAMGRLDALVDRRLFIGVGLVFVAAGLWRMSQFDLAMGGRTIVEASLLLGMGQGMILVPLTTLAFGTLSPALRPDASAVTNLVRNLGGSVGISVMQALTAFNGQSMHAALAAHVRPDDPVVRAGLPPALSPHTVQGALTLNEEITRQATMVAYVSDFRLLFFVAALCAPLLLLLRQPRARAAPAIESLPEAHAG